MKECVETELGTQDEPFALLTGMLVKTEEDGDRSKVVMRGTVAEGRDESGNTTYKVNRDPQDPTLFYLYDRWKNYQAVEDHENIPHFQVGIDELKEVIDKSGSVTVMKIAAGSAS